MHNAAVVIDLDAGVVTHLPLGHAEVEAEDSGTLTASHLALAPGSGEGHPLARTARSDSSTSAHAPWGPTSRLATKRAKWSWFTRSTQGLADALNGQPPRRLIRSTLAARSAQSGCSGAEGAMSPIRLLISEDKRASARLSA